MDPRRTIPIGRAALLTGSPLTTLAEGIGPAIRVTKDSNRDCCSVLTEILENDGFPVTTEVAMARF
ncbi:MAG: hypothetical protein LDL44_11620 [Caenispirillum sp.]|jgi:hypothetical protein|nr:hypothetical protein [Caenispirillum sp.]